MSLQDVFVGLVVGSLFSGLNTTSFQTTMGFLFFCMLFLSFGGMAEVPIAYQLAEVVYKQNKARFYKVSAYVIADAAVRLPLAVVDSVVFGTIIYWCGSCVTVVAVSFFGGGIDQLHNSISCSDGLIDYLIDGCVSGLRD
jgi:hypothetical protein